MQSLTPPSVSTVPQSSRAVDAARRRPWGNVVLFFLIACVGCFIDLATKHWVFAWRGFSGYHNDVWWIWDGYLGIQTAINYGALFGMGQGFTNVFVIMSFIALCGILYWLFTLGAVQDRLLTVALATICGGILGNLYDRLGLWSIPGVTDTAAVRDWILFCYGKFTWPNFNIADSMLVCGAIFLVWHSFRSSHEIQRLVDENQNTTTESDEMTKS